MKISMLKDTAQHSTLESIYDINIITFELMVTPHYYTKLVLTLYKCSFF